MRRQDEEKTRKDKKTNRQNIIDMLSRYHKSVGILFFYFWIVPEINDFKIYHSTQLEKWVSQLEKWVFQLEKSESRNAELPCISDALVIIIIIIRPQW